MSDIEALIIGGCTMVPKTCGLATRMTADSSRYEALFASVLQRSDAPAADVVAEAIARTVRQFGARGCASRMAQEFGDHPEAAAERMRWVRQLLTQIPAPALTWGRAADRG